MATRRKTATAAAAAPKSLLNEQSPTVISHYKVFNKSFRGVLPPPSLLNDDDKCLPLKVVNGATTQKIEKKKELSLSQCV